MNSGEESALPMVSSSSSASNKYEGTVREACYWPKGQTPHLAECQWDIASMKSTWKRNGSKSRFRQKKKR